MRDPGLPAAISPRATAWVAKKAPRMFRPTTASKSFAVVCVAGAWRASPALLTSTSKGPSLSTALAVAATSVTSIASASALKPSVSSARTASASLSIDRADKTTCAPCSANATAQPSPMPEEAPVTRARRPSSRNEGVRGSFIWATFVRPSLGSFMIRRRCAIGHVAAAITPHADIGLFSMTDEPFEHAEP